VLGQGGAVVAQVRPRLAVRARLDVAERGVTVREREADPAGQADDRRSRAGRLARGSVAESRRDRGVGVLGATPPLDRARVADGQIGRPGGAPISGRGGRPHRWLCDVPQTAHGAPVGDVTPCSTAKARAAVSSANRSRTRSGAVCAHGCELPDRRVCRGAGKALIEARRGIFISVNSRSQWSD
jgi:hypothetical protein